MTHITTSRCLKSLLLTAVSITFGATLFNVKSANALIPREAFADEVVNYTTNNDSYLTNSPFTNPLSALGVNDWDYQMMNGAPKGKWEKNIGTSLGKGGSLTVKFTDNALTFSGDSSDDLRIYEIGRAVETAFVEISTDNQNWYELGEFQRDYNKHDTGIGIDIDSILANELIAPDTLFRYVRVTDTGNNTYTNAKSGLDIDAIAALSSVDVPEPTSIIGLLSLGIVGVSTLKRKQ